MSRSTITERRMVSTRMRQPGTSEYITVDGVVEVTINIDEIFRIFGGLALKAKTGRSRQAKGTIVLKGFRDKTRYRVQDRATGTVLGYKLAPTEAEAVDAWLRTGTMGYTHNQLVAVAQ